MDIKVKNKETEKIDNKDAEETTKKADTETEKMTDTDTEKEKISNYRNKIRKSVVKKCVSIIRSIGLPDEITAFMMRSFHINSPIYALLLVALLPMKYSVFIVFFAIFVIVSGIFFKGCVLSGVEKELCKNTPSCEEFIFYTVIDPFIILFGKNINHYNRNMFSLIVTISWFCIIICIFLLRKVYFSLPIDISFTIKK